VGGTTRIGGGTSDSAWGQAFAVSPSLAAGQVVTATQTVGSDTSDPSPALTVVNAVKRGAKLPQPIVSAPLYDCGGALSVTNLAKGGQLRVFADGNPIGSVNGTGSGQWLRVSPVLSMGQNVTADELLCTGVSPLSGAVPVSAKPATLPALSIGDIYDGGKYCVIDGITNGALVTTNNGIVVVDQGHYPGGGQVVRLTPPPNAGDTITAVQALCATTSPVSPPTVVQPCSSLPPPTLAAVCPGATTVTIANSVIDARIQVYTDGGVLVADGGGHVINLFSPAKAGQNYTAVQSLGSCVSQPSSPLSVGCAPPEQIPVRIPGGGRAVAIGVDPSDSHNIMVASETGGMFRSADRAVHWSHVTGATTFRYTDVAYSAWNAKTIIATADRDTRRVSGGGIWRSTDGGSNWVKPNLTYPSSDCRDNAAAFGLAVEPKKNKIWAGTICGLAYSDTAGATWTYLAPVTGYNNDTTYAVLAPDDQRLVILTPTGVKVSKTSGASFTQSNTGLPNGAGGNTHNQIAVPQGNKEHIYWAFNYWKLVDPATNDWKPHIALYRSTDFGSTWAEVIDKEGNNRPPFVRLANALSGAAGKYDIYFSDGGCTLQRATADTGSAAGISSWTSLNFDHCDPADLAFDNDNKTPLLLASDGGLHLTRDSGSNWTLAGAGLNGYNALQLTEVIGQFHKDNKSVDLYFATQDNDIWTSPDGGATWPTNRCCEGFFLNIPRAYYPPDKTKLTGVSCAGCGNFMSDQLLANQQGFPNPPNDNGNPRLLKPGNYIHNTKDPANAGSTFVLSTDTGASWNSRYFFSEEVRDLSQITGPTDDPVVYTPKKSPGTTPDGQEVVQLKRIDGVLGAGSATVSDVTGINMGIFATMFAWYKVFGVDPGNPNYLMVPDTVDRVVKTSTDGGGSWMNDNLLTSSVTQGTEFMYYWAPFVQVSSIGVDPDCRGHILVGTQQAGILTTYDSGATWGRVAGTEVIPYVSRFFFKGGGEVFASSYGRGLWKLKYQCPKNSGLTRPPPPFRRAEPVMYWKGAKIPLSQVNPLRSCPKCGFVLAKDGRITDYSIDSRTNQIKFVTTDRGSLQAYTFGGSEFKLPFQVKSKVNLGSFSGDKELVGLLKNDLKVKGLFIEGTTLKGVLLAPDDIGVSQLPRILPPAPRISVESKDESNRIEIGSGPIRIRGKGFDSKYPLAVLLDGKPLDSLKVTWLSNDEFVIWIPTNLSIGGHTVVVRQRTDKGVIQDTTTFLITVSDRIKKR